MKKRSIYIVAFLFCIIVAGSIFYYRFNLAAEVDNIGRLAFCKDSAGVNVFLTEPAYLIKNYEYSLRNRVLTLKLRVVSVYDFNIDKLTPDIKIPVNYDDFSTINVCNEEIQIDSIKVCR